MENQKLLESNRTKSHAVGTGAAKKGRALLGGLLRCAQCGHKLNVGYRGRDGRAPRYYCSGGLREKSGPQCLSFGGVKAARAVVEVVLEACQPLGVEASLQRLKGGRHDHEQKRRALELALERARYAVNLARRQYDSVDPANRLVVSELEARWNAALAQVSEAEARLQSEQSTQAPVSESERCRLLELGADLQALWDDPGAPVELKKRILRTVLSEIVVTANHSSEYIEMRLHWAGGVHTTLCVRKNKTGRNDQATEPRVIELVRELAKARPDSYIAATLNRLGYHTGPGNTWNEIRVRHLRNYHHIPVFVTGTERPWKSAEEAAKELDVGVAVVRTMIRRRILPARQIAKDTPWLIKPEDLRRPEVLGYAKTAHTGKPAPREAEGQIAISYL